MFGLFGSKSGFNQIPVLKVRPLGMSGNAALVVGFATFGVSWYLAQVSGRFLPRAPGLIYSPQGVIPMDLTPDALLEKKKEE